MQMRSKNILSFCSFLPWYFSLFTDNATKLCNGPKKKPLNYLALHHIQTQPKFERTNNVKACTKQLLPLVIAVGIFIIDGG